MINGADLVSVAGMLVIGLITFCFFGLPQILEYLSEKNKLKYGKR